MIRRRYQAPRRARPAPAQAPVAAPTRSRRPEDHLILQGGLTCHCGEKACYWMRCRVKRCVVATCGGHRMTTVQERDAHEAAHQVAP